MGLNTTGEDLSLLEDTVDHNITCREDFFLSENSMCLPLCNAFEEHNHVATQTMLIAEIIAAIIACLVSILALALSAYNRKNM